VTVPISSPLPLTSSRPAGPCRSGSRPAVASSAIAPLLRGADRAVTVLASFPQAAYLSVGDDLVALVTSDGIHHPNAVVLDLPSSERPLDRLAIAPRGRIGRHGLSIGDLELHIVRWWDPRPRLRGSTPAALRAASDLTRQRLAAVAGPLPEASHTARTADLANALGTVVAALRVGDGEAAFAAAQRIVGLGPGLTPSGDDRLAGLIAGTLVLAPSIASASSGGADGGASTDLPAATERLGHAVAAAAVGRTTSVSAALLRHAASGQMAEPASALVRAWVAADRDTVRATDRLLAVGSSSGRDLTLGLLAAVELLTDERARPSRTGPTSAEPARALSPRPNRDPRHHTTERHS